MEIDVWQQIPDHIIVNVFGYLSLSERYYASLVCKSWQQCFHSQYLWRTFEFNLNKDNAEFRNFADCVVQHGRHFRDVSIYLYQKDAEKRKCAVEIINLLCKVRQGKLNKFGIYFTGENPLFYAGLEFVEALKTFFGYIPDELSPRHSLVEVNLSGLQAAFDDSLIDELSKNHPEIESLNLFNRILVCKVTPDCILRLVKRCQKLQDLRVYHTSLSDEILETLAEDDRSPIQYLAIGCRRELKYESDLTSNAWAKLVAKIPEFRVSLHFDHTVPQVKVADVFKPEIPLKQLRLETFSILIDEIKTVSRFYCDTLETLILQTRNSYELGVALLDLAHTCKQLTCLKVYCILDKEVVQGIHAELPQLREKGNYILKSEMVPEPWMIPTRKSLLTVQREFPFK
ncbi:F-box/LRR-repeat protein 8-like [Mytilus trossulus]|uniref:F-box/LRR-repeat protein 8-like n=1 Tax=Mytilus trossulus TaxID=6551 RepID=UPI00300701B5